MEVRNPSFTRNQKIILTIGVSIGITLLVIGILAAAEVGELKGASKAFSLSMIGGGAGILLTTLIIGRMLKANEAVVLPKLPVNAEVVEVENNEIIRPLTFRGGNYYLKVGDKKEYLVIREREGVGHSYKIDRGEFIIITKYDNAEIAEDKLRIYYRPHDDVNFKIDGSTPEILTKPLLLMFSYSGDLNVITELLKDTKYCYVGLNVLELRNWKKLY